MRLLYSVLVVLRIARPAESQAVDSSRAAALVGCYRVTPGFLASGDAWKGSARYLTDVIGGEPFAREFVLTPRSCSGLPDGERQLQETPGGLVDLATLAERTHGLCVRIQRSDGSAIEGLVLSVGSSDLFVLDDATRQHVRVFAHELRVLEVSLPRRARVWVLVLIAIPAAVAGLIGYAQLPWVPERPGAGHILPGFLILVGIGAGVMRTALVRRWLGPWLTKWRRVYPPMASHEQS